MTSALLLGLLLGVRHALDADHIAAVATIVTRTSSVRRGLLEGAAWGLGHTFTLLMLGTVVLLFGAGIRDDVANALEGCVGLMLILLGLDLARRVLQERLHVHAHDHGDGIAHTHLHAHSHDQNAGDPHQHSHPKPLPLRSLAIGFMHGLAGTAALIVLAVGASQSAWQGIAYIALFGAGSIVGMALVSLVMAYPLQKVQGKGWVQSSVMGVVSAANVVLGVVLVVRTMG